MYYNTTNETGEALKAYKKKTISQDKEILDFMQDHSDQSFSASQLLQLLFRDRDVPITNIRRTLCNLNGLDIRATGRMKSPYGRPETMYKAITKAINKNGLIIEQ